MRTRTPHLDSTGTFDQGNSPAQFATQEVFFRGAWRLFRASRTRETEVIMCVWDPITCLMTLNSQQKRNLECLLTPVVRLPLLTQPARHGLKYVIPSDPQTGSYSCILQPQLTLQLPVRFLWGMVREGLREREREKKIKAKNGIIRQWS